MSKDNKVNPGTYTQAGRLSPDDAAREMKKQREMASSTKTDEKPRSTKHETPKDTQREEDAEESGKEQLP